MDKHAIIKKLKESFFGKFPRISYARSGEDLILEEILGINKISGTYVDIGAFHPVNYSNTYKYYLKGWSGINIDASRESIDLFNKVRKRDTNINIAIAETEGAVDYVIFNEDRSMNTSCGTFEAHALGHHGMSVKERRQVRSSTLGNVLNEHLASEQEIDFFSIDVEGSDMCVLRSNNWERFHPKAIVIESNDLLHQVMESEITAFLSQFNYRPVAYSLVTMEAGNIYYATA